jgi:hypothetical protein
MARGKSKNTPRRNARATARIRAAEIELDSASRTSKATVERQAIPKRKMTTPAIRLLRTLSCTGGISDGRARARRRAVPSSTMRSNTGATSPKLGRGTAVSRD